MLQDFHIAVALLGHLNGSPLAHAHAVAIAFCGKDNTVTISLPR